MSKDFNPGIQTRVKLKTLTKLNELTAELNRMVFFDSEVMSQSATIEVLIEHWRETHPGSERERELSRKHAPTYGPRSRRQRAPDDPWGTKPRDRM